MTLALERGDVIIVAELYNDKAKFDLKCFIGNSQTSYRFDQINKLSQKLPKLLTFIKKHSTVRF